VLACVTAVASTLGSLPVLAYRAAPGGGREEAPGHPVSGLLRRPHPRLPWCDLAEWWVAQTLLWGNGLLELVRGPTGAVVELRPIPWPQVHVVQLPSGRLAYDVTEGGDRRRLLEGEVIHLRDRSDDGLVGRSRLSRAGAVLRNAMGLQSWSAAMWERGGSPSGAIKMPGVMSEEAFDRFKKQVNEEVVGLQNARRVLVLEGGAEWQAFTFSPEDAEMLASRRFGVEELARLFGVPPPMIGDLSHGTFTNSREAARWFAQFTLAPWARKIEAAMGAALFGTDDTGMSVEVDLSALLRGDPEARWQSHQIAVQAGILDPDEIREIEGWGPRRTMNPSTAP
jgi:HK97 family phage portal protein